MDGIVFTEEGIYIEESSELPGQYNFSAKTNDVPYFTESQIGPFKLRRAKGEIPVVEGSPEVHSNETNPTTGKFLIYSDAVKIIDKIYSENPGPGKTEKSLVGNPIDTVANLLFIKK